MSSEHIHDRAAVNFYGEQGAYTALFVSSVSSNDEPLTPRWSLYGISKKMNAMDRVIKYVHYCDEGMTKGPRGAKLSPAHEIKKWRDAIEEAKTPQWDCPASLKFTKDPTLFENSFDTLEIIVNAAKAKGLSLKIHDLFGAMEYHEIYGNTSPKVGVELILDLAVPAEADFAWEITREGTKVATAGSTNTCLVNPHDLMKKVVGEIRMQGFAAYKRDERATKTVVRKDEQFVPPKVLKFEYVRYPDQPQYTETMFVMVEDGRVLDAGNAMSSFCRNKLVLLESGRPGTAESAYQQFKKFIDSLATTSLEGIEVLAKRPDPNSIPDWSKDVVSKLFDGAEMRDEAAQIYVMEPGKTITALEMSDVISLQLKGEPMEAGKKAETQTSLFG